MASIPQRPCQQMRVHFQSTGKGLGYRMFEMGDDADPHRVSSSRARGWGWREAISPLIFVEIRDQASGWASRSTVSSRDQ